MYKKIVFIVEGIFKTPKLTIFKTHPLRVCFNISTWWVRYASSHTSVLNNLKRHATCYIYGAFEGWFALPFYNNKKQKNKEKQRKIPVFVISRIRDLNYGHKNNLTRGEKNTYLSLVLSYRIFVSVKFLCRFNALGTSAVIGRSFLHTIILGN